MADMRKKLASRRGETLLEVLISIALMSLLFVMLTSATLAATRTNKRVKEIDQSFQYSDTAKQSGSYSIPAGEYNNKISVDVWSAMKEDSSNSSSAPKYYYFEKTAK